MPCVVDGKSVSAFARMVRAGLGRCRVTSPATPIIGAGGETVAAFVVKLGERARGSAGAA